MYTQFSGIINLNRYFSSLNNCKRIEESRKDNENDSKLFNTKLIVKKIKRQIDSGESILESFVYLLDKDVDEIVKYVINDREDYVLTNDSPIQFRRNFDICLRSIINDFRSAFFIDWEYFLNYTEKSSDLFIELYNCNRIYCSYYLEHFKIRKLDDFFKLYGYTNNKKLLEYLDLTSTPELATDEKLKGIIDSYAEDNNIILSNSSPLHFRRNYSICINTINNMPSNSIFVDWEYFSTYPIIARHLVSALYNNYDNYIQCIDGFKITSLDDFFELYNDTKDDRLVRFMDLNSILTENINVNNYLQENDSETNTYINNLLIFLSSLSQKHLTISKTKGFLRMYYEKEWINFRNRNSQYYFNVFSNLRNSVESSDSISLAHSKFKLIDYIASVLDDDTIISDFNTLFYMVHNHEMNSEEERQLLEQKIKTKIAKYISMSKEMFISEGISESLKSLKAYFVLKKGNHISNKIGERKQKRKIANLYKGKDPNILSYIKETKDYYLKGEYSYLVEKEDIIDRFIDSFINSNNKSFEELVRELNLEPEYLEEYESYLKIIKLINRLNSGYIDFSDPQVQKYSNSIRLDGDKYVYNGLKFSNENLGNLKEYKDLEYVLRKIADKLALLIKSISISDEETKEEINNYNFPFSDEYYELDFNKILVSNDIAFLYSIIINRDNFLDEEKLQLVNQLAITSGFLQFLMILEKNEDKGLSNYFSYNNFSSIITRISEIESLIGHKRIDICNYDFLSNICNGSYFIDLKTMCILGADVIEKICRSTSYQVENVTNELKINEATFIITNMCYDTRSTIPYIEGNEAGFNYSLYSPLDTSVLLSGIDTGTCFKVGGTDNDYFMYCLLDKNGFVVKITDDEGNMIAKVPGIRNGNGIYLGVPSIRKKILSNFKNADLKQVLKTIGDELINKSQNNMDETNKIEFVMIISDIDYPSVSDDTIEAIGGFTVDNESDDWLEFINCPYIYGANKSNYFTTDYAIVIAMAKKYIKLLSSSIGPITPNKIKSGDVPALYKKGKEYNETIVNPNLGHELLINRIKAIKAHMFGLEFNYLQLPENCTLQISNNGYRVMLDGDIYDECYLNEDELNTYKKRFIYN